MIKYCDTVIEESNDSLRSMVAGMRGKLWKSPKIKKIDDGKSFPLKKMNNNKTNYVF